LEAESSDAGKDGDEATMEPTITDLPNDSGEDDPMDGVGSEAESSDSDAGTNGDEETEGPTIADEPTENKDTSEDAAVAAQVAVVGLRRSARNKQSPQVVTPLPLPSVVVMRKTVVRRDRVLVLVSVLSNAIPQKLTTRCSGWPGG
jgi:hypothetical protein